ncbi:actin like protein ALP2a [Cardiosporidium cionae]|uniref:Actin like protein ALP2a n=1 Tax=Cardiosporidium cionae TaxID=476202 RepID=A0ABQ7JA75_9APIC|nr:actin like protein ALP2a [Cardiosporidium cionae]|eukprot:KAF8820860.1 actin like protein ALP2a [Cardiosporidium cionae]
MYMSGTEEIISLVVDIGSHTTRAGFAGEEGPKQLWNSCAGLPLTSVSWDTPTLCDSIPSWGVEKLLYPLNFHEKRENCAVKPCLFLGEDGQHQMHDDVFEKIVAYTCEGSPAGRSLPASSLLDKEGMVENEWNYKIHGLGAALQEYPVLLSEPTRPSRAVRQKMTEIMFEKFDSPAMYLAKRAMLSTFAMGRSSGLIVDIGAGVLSIAPILDGYVRGAQALEYPVAGDMLDMQFSHILAEHSIPLHPTYAVKRLLNDSGKVYTVQKMDCSHVHTSYLHYSQYETVRNLKEAICKVAEEGNDIQLAQSNSSLSSGPSPSIIPFTNIQFNELPDGTRLEPEEFMYKVPEILFTPNLIKASNSQLVRNFKGLPTAIAQCILQCEMETRKDLLNAIILTGGTSLLAGLVDRLTRSLQGREDLFGVMAPTKIRLLSPNTSIEKKFSTWVGGSILASLGSFHQMWISKEEYKEHGPHIVERKCN